MSIGAGECWDWGVRPGWSRRSYLDISRATPSPSYYVGNHTYLPISVTFLGERTSKCLKCALNCFVRCLCYWPWVAHLTLEVSSAPWLSLLRPTPDQAYIPFHCQRYPSLQLEKFPLVHHEYFWTSQPSAFPCTGLCMELDCANFYNGCQSKIPIQFTWGKSHCSLGNI